MSDKLLFLDCFSIVWIITALFIIITMIKEHRILKFFLLCSPVICLQGIRIFLYGLMMYHSLITTSIGAVMIIIGGWIWLQFII